MIFNDYANYYDLLYKDKDYKKETDYINTLIVNNNPKTNLRILDIGCGTGIHANLLAEKGHQLTGIDLSKEMINIANINKHINAHFFNVDASNYNFKEKFDVILSLFHVISYQSNNKELFDFLRNASTHLKSNGLFIFDFWYGPAVLSIKPSTRVKRLQNKEITLHRIAESEVDIRQNTVDVNYNLLVTNNNNNLMTEVNETHRMRYYFEVELESYLSKFGFEIVNFEEWLTSSEPNIDTWGVCCITKLIK